MKRMLTAVSAVLIGFGFITATFAQAPAEEPAAPEKPARQLEKMESMTYSGKVVSIDAVAHTIVVEGEKGEWTFSLSDTKWKGYRSANEVKTGDKVTIRYIKKLDGKMMATSVGKTL